MVHITSKVHGCVGALTAAAYVGEVIKPSPS